MMGMVQENSKLYLHLHTASKDWKFPCSSQILRCVSIAESVVNMETSNPCQKLVAPQGAVHNHTDIALYATQVVQNVE